VREHAGVVQKFLLVGRALGYVAEPDDEELQCRQMVAARSS
jgi:hypothetical protein